MQAEKQYIVQFVGLSLGEHKYQFEVNDKFFESLDYSEIKQGNSIVNLNLLKQSSMMILQFEIGGTIKVNCDRCMEEYDLPINGNFKLIVKIGGTPSEEEDDDILTIATNEHELNLSQYIYEYISLSLPIKRVHPDDKNGKSTCNKAALKKLEKFLTHEEKQEITDPRWNGLKNIKLN